MTANETTLNCWTYKAIFFFIVVVLMGLARDFARQLLFPMRPLVWIQSFVAVLFLDFGPLSSSCLCLHH